MANWDLACTVFLLIANPSCKVKTHHQLSLSVDCTCGSLTLKHNIEHKKVLQPLSDLASC